MIMLIRYRSCFPHLSGQNNQGVLRWNRWESDARVLHEWPRSHDNHPLNTMCIYLKSRQIHTRPQTKAVHSPSTKKNHKNSAKCCQCLWIVRVKECECVWYCYCTNENGLYIVIVCRYRVSLFLSLRFTDLSFFPIIHICWYSYCGIFIHSYGLSYKLSERKPQGVSILVSLIFMCFSCIVKRVY